MLPERSYHYNATVTCGQLGLDAEPVWFSEQAELDWLQTFIQEQSIDCLHTGDNAVMFYNRCCMMAK